MNTLTKTVVACLAAAVMVPPVYAMDVTITPPGLGRQLRRAGEAVKEVVKNRHPKVAIGTGKITTINGTTLSVEKDGKTYTVKTGTFDRCTTHIVRRFWGKSELSELAAGHIINVIGRWEDEAKTTVDACVIRDTSIQKRFGIFVGEVVSLTSSGWVMNPVGEKRDNQTVTVSSSTKFVNRKEESIGQADVKVGHRVRVKGLWDRSNNTVTEVTHVKDFSLPVRPTGTPTPTP